MSDLDEFRRMNFFTGFFTTAEDWNQGQVYHLAKRRLHNRGLHTPGVLRGVGDDLRVEAADGLDVRVLSGVALDGQGNEICLAQPRTLSLNPPDTVSQLFYVTIEYGEQQVEYVENVETPQYSGHTRVAEIPILRITSARPDNQTSLELARIDLQSGVTEIAYPADPENPGGNEIDRRYVVWAGSVSVVEEWLPAGDREELVLLMQDKRRDFAALEIRFPVPSAGDVRHAAVTVEMLARTDALRPEHLPDTLAALAAIEQDAGQELGQAYPAMVTMPQYQAYQIAVDGLLTALQEGQGIEALLNHQHQISDAARELSEVVLQPPSAVVANREDLSLIRTTQEETTVELDADGSEAYGEREIVEYHWEKTA